MEIMMGMIIVLVVLAIGFLIGAVFLQAAAKWEGPLYVPFGEAYATVFISGLLGIGVWFLLQLIAVAMPAVQFLSYPIGFLIQVGVISWRLSVTFGKALLISLVMFALSIAVCVIIGFIGFVFLRIIS